MKVKKIIVNSLWFGVVPKLATFLNVLLLPLITPYLTNYDYGIWGIVSSYSGMAVALYTLGLHMHLTNSYYEYKNRYNIVWSRLLSILIFSSIVFSIILSVILYITLSDIKPILRLLVVFLSTFPVLFNCNTLYAQHLFTLRGTPKPLVLRNLSSSLAGILTTFFLIYKLNLGYVGFVVGAALNSLLAFVLFIKPVWINEKIYPQKERSYKRIKEYLKISMPVMPHALGFLLLSSFSRIIMSWYGVPLEDIGIYTHGYVIGDYTTVISVAIVTALAPQIQNAYRNKQFSEYRKLFYFSQGVVLFAVFLFSMWMPEIYSILIRNKELHKSISVAQFSCFANAVFPLYTFMSAIVFIEKRTKQLLYLVFVPGILNVFLCLIFIPIFGYKSAIFTTIVAYWSQIFIPFFIGFFRTSTTLWMGNLSKLFLLFIVFVVLLIFSLFFSQMNMLLKIFLSFLMFSFFCVKMIQNKNVI